MIVNRTFPANNRILINKKNFRNLIPKTPTTSKKKSIRKVITDFIKTNDHPCLSAQSVVNNEALTIGEYNTLGSEASAAALAKDLTLFIENRISIKSRLVSFMAVFQMPEMLTEKQFEDLLWKQLELLHSVDTKQWDAAVSNDPEDRNFSFSFGGKAFYIIGMHPKSSRMARQFPYPALVFNLHQQFEELRGDGHYDKMRDIIRERDRKLQGSVNAMVADHGTSSEAKQYSGRKVDESWKCPFHNKKQ